jgi:uncharacterized protein YdhG (YjbR/CyaY superfamily)
VSDDPVETYLADLDEPRRSTLAELGAMLSELLPDAEPVLAYGAPAFRVGGKNVAGFAASKSHLSYLPHSGEVLGSLRDDLDGYEWSKGALRFPVDEPLPLDLVVKLVGARMRELGLPFEG